MNARAVIDEVQSRTSSPVQHKLRPTLLVLTHAVRRLTEDLFCQLNFGTSTLVWKVAVKCYLAILGLYMVRCM